jgi:energy-coupling factor transporter ATP-binding protein EcfA2
MAGTITIRQLKNIKELHFEIPGPGVHLLSGTNGAGKTSILACLQRIGHATAFARHFAVSQHSTALDNFDGAQVTYTLGVAQVTYSYGGERWVPRPRAQNRLLAQFGYPSVLYIGATADRITPRPEDFQPSRVRPANLDIRTAANRIFGTNKFDGLRTINLTRGAGNPAFVLQATPPPGAKYYSERNFSLGELCVLKLIRSLRDCPNNSLVLIDELELALHPKAQIELLGFLTEMAHAKHLTVIFSTHSASLLKRVDRRQIIFLENVNGTVNTVVGCYPTYALGNIAYDEERAPDVVLYVEDDAAVYVLDTLVRLFIGTRFASQTASFPTVHVIPIGPFMNVVRFLARSEAILPLSTRTSALLDQDVQAETVTQWTAANNYTALAEFQRFASRIAYLPWTPEVGLVGFLTDIGAGAQRRIREHFADHRIVLRPEDIGLIPPSSGRDQRDTCKRSIRNVATYIAALLPNQSVEQVRKALFELFGKWYFDTQRPIVMQLLGPRI